MMLQAPETELLQTVTSGRTPLLNSQISFRSGHDVLGELTNLIWGQIKATVLDAHDQGRRGLVAELPLIINENRKYLTFGATEPALCLSYKIREADTGNLLLEVHQKFLFTMTWRPGFIWKIRRFWRIFWPRESSRFQALLEVAYE